MAPVPLEGNQTPVANIPQEGNRGGSISLGLLIDFIIQRTYHEITVLAELLPRKTDMERKIEIFNFAARTRQLFVRLLALTKWANSATKVEKSNHIMAFLDKQSLLFVDTADMLARMARETLVHARLPNFHLPAAVEVLTTGSYNRLPTCIREKIVPPDPITLAEKKSTLQRLNQVIQHRLVTGNLLPQMKNLEIDAGRVTFKIEQEFCVSLTVMGDAPNLPWRLLDLEILVSDRETGEGKSLVHPLQTQYVHQVVQTRLAESSDPLAEVYCILHHFCQSLQLEVLYSQTLRLIRDRLDDHIRIDKYKTGEFLTISYWKELTSKDSGSELGYKLSILVDQVDPAKPLAVVHTPSLASKECEVSDLAIRSNQLSMEYLLVHTIYIRTRNRLNDLRQELQIMFKGIECTLAGSPAILSVPIIQPCLRAELLLIAVDTHTGMLQCHIPQFEAPIVPELTNALNQDRSKLPALIAELRFWIVQKRCTKTLQHLPATALTKLPLLHSPDHPINAISKHKMYIEFHKHPKVVLIMGIKENESSPCELQYSFYLCSVKLTSSEQDAGDDTNIEAKNHHIFYKLESLIEFDTFVVTHGSFTSIDCGSNEPEISGIVEAADKAGKKRKPVGPTARADGNSAPKKAKAPAYYIPELAHVVALCDEQIPFMMLAQELSKRDIAHQGLQIEANATGMFLKLVQLPKPGGSISTQVAWNALLKRLLSCCIRVQSKGTGKNWMVEFVFYGSPVLSSHPREQGLRRPVYFQYPMGTPETVTQTVDKLLNDWTQIVNLYSLVHDLAEYFKMEKSNYRNIATVKSYSYNRLVLSYGPHRRAQVTILWDVSIKQFKLYFGKSATSPLDNAHMLLREQLEATINRDHNLMQLMHILNETLAPLTSIARLPTTLQLGINEKRPQIPMQTFVVMPQCISLVRIAYQNIYCLELCFRGDGFVTLRDGAYSRFDHSSVVDGFTPIQGLTTFLSQYVDKTAMYRGRSQSEDDNPPSPTTVEGDPSGLVNNGSAGPPSAGYGSFLAGHHRAGPQSPAQNRFHPPVTPPSNSNPTTPASPHTSQQQQQHGYTSSPAASLNMVSSPPSLTPSTPSVLPHPSPGSGLVASPLGQMHAPSPAGLLPTSSPGPCGGPMTGHSPASGYGMQPHDGSPFPAQQSLASPVASNWANSPSISRPSPARSGQSPGGLVAMHSPQQPLSVGPVTMQQTQHVSRVLPQRSWAGAIPSLLSAETLELLCSPARHPNGLAGPDLAPLERFLCCVFMRRQLQRCIQTNDSVTILNGEPGVTHFKVESLQCRVSPNPQHMQSLHLKCQPLPEHVSRWSHEELQVIERFFEHRAVAPPFRPNSLHGFMCILNLPINVLKDFIQIMRIELAPPALAQQQQYKWQPQFCLRVPPSANPIMPVGGTAVIQNKTKTLFYLQITRLGSYESEPPSLVLPLIYDTRTNLTQIADRDSPPGSPMAAISLLLKRFTDHYPNQQECSAFPAVRNILTNFTLPSEVAAAAAANAAAMQQQQQQQQQQQMTPQNPNIAGGPMPPVPIPGPQPPPQAMVPGPAMQMMQGAGGAQGPPPPQGPYRQAMPPGMNMMGGPQ